MKTIENLTSLGVKPTRIKSVYSFLSNQFDNYLLFTMDNLAIHKEIRTEYPHLLSFLRENNNEAIGIVYRMYNQPYAIKFRSEVNKSFYFLTKSRPLPYGIDFDSKFVYGTPILIVEGEKDRDALSLLYPYTIALQTSSMNKNLMHLLTSITNKLFLLYDNDESGLKGMYRDRKILFSEKPHVFVNILKQHPELKDSGSLLDSLYTQDPNYPLYLAYYRQLIEGELNALY